MTDGPIELVILGRGRSGSNLLCDSLKGLNNHAGFFEVLSNHAVIGLNSNADFHPHIESRIGFSFGDQSDQKLVDCVAADRLGFLDILAKSACELGYGSISYKIFHSQLRKGDLELLLARPNLRLMFLTRSRIDQYISGAKGGAIRKYVEDDTTDVKVSVSMSEFLQSAFSFDTFMESALAQAKQKRIPHTIMSYERDLDLPADERNNRIEAALRSVAFEAPSLRENAPKWLVKQDRSANWQAKIFDSLELSAALAGLGLTEYAESAPLNDLDGTPLHQSPAKVDLPLLRPKDALLKDGGYFRLHSRDPVITFSAIQYDRSTLARWMAGPEPAFGKRRGLHFLKPTWTMETSSLKALAEDIRAAERDNPGHIFAALSTSLREAENYRGAGIRAIQGNGNIFEDEARWTIPHAPHPNLPDSDAIYIARLADWKNHHLATELDAPLFVYGPDGDEPIDTTVGGLRALHPSAIFVNHLLGNGRYHYLDGPTLAATMARARTALALSFVEGYMRASAQYLMAGLPIVSVPSVGGRDAFFCNDNSLIVDPDPRAVAEGVQQMIARRLSRDEVRRATLQIVRAARTEFEAAANRLAAEHLGPAAPEIRTEQVLGWTIPYTPLSQLIEALNDPV